MENKKIKVLFLSAEVTPIAKVGGLGDVAGALPKALASLNADVRLCLPFYGFIRGKYRAKKIAGFKMPFNGREEKIEVFQTALPKTKIPVYLLKHALLSGQTIYGSQQTNEKDGRYLNKEEDLLKFAFFTRVSLAAAQALNFKPEIIHANDWHTALSADYLKTFNKENIFLKNTKTIYTIHNLANQGMARPELVKISGLNPKLPVIKADLKNGDLNFMVQGILSSDFVTTVSPTYAKEILTHRLGADLDNILRKRKKDLYGILNGLDTDSYNPAADEFIKQKYSPNTIDKKTVNKLWLQKKLGWRPDKNIALVGLVSRLVWQKGLELITEKLSELACQFIFLGTGQPEYEKYLKNLEKKFPEKFSARINFDEKLARQIYAGADIFLVPSRFEPCGLTQLIAMRYGAVPLARATGGLADTVNENVGFSFKEFSQKKFSQTLKKALEIYYEEPARWRQLRINGMKKNFSWNKSAREYLKIYRRAMAL